MLRSSKQQGGSAARFLKGAGTVGAALCAIVIAAGPIAHRAQAGEWDKMTTLTVNEPIQVSDTYLDPGTYVLRLADIGSARHIVQIYNRDQTRIINTVMAIPNYRLEPTGDSRFMFWETPRGNVKAMRAWFYPGDNFGQEFRYPKQPRQIAAVNTPQAAPPQFASTPPEPATKVQAPQPPAPETISRTVPAPEPDQPVEIAQATPAPAPPVVVEQAAPAHQPEELPKTASPYPVVGLSGLVMFGLFGALRLSRTS
jgi:hypothetical protein